MSVKHSDEAEEGLLGELLDDPQSVIDVLERGVSSDDFYRPHNGLVFDAIVEAHYADERIDALSIGVKLRDVISAALGCDPQTAVKHVQSLKTNANGSAGSRAAVLQELADARRMQKVLGDALAQLEAGQLKPAEVAGATSEAVMKVIRGAKTKPPISALDAGREFLRELQVKRQLRAQGIELGCWFDIPALDDHLQGLQGGELFVLAGEPGVGKSAVGWRMGLNFARRQAQHPPDRQIGTFILSLEMHQSPSMARMAQTLTGVDGTKLRTGNIDDTDFRRIAEGWKHSMTGVPLHFDHPAKMRASQIKATVNAMIERHNVGLVIIDHFRSFDLDYRLQNKNDEDEEKVRFLKEDLALGLDVAVVCLAHTRKKDTAKAADARPTLSDLRGSGQIAAHSDFTAFVFRPNKYGSDEPAHFVGVDETLAELIWEKNRHGLGGVANFYFDPATMTVR